MAEGKKEGSEEAKTGEKISRFKEMTKVREEKAEIDVKITTVEAKKNADVAKIKADDNHATKKDAVRDAKDSVDKHMTAYARAKADKLDTKDIERDLEQAQKRRNVAQETLDIVDSKINEIEKNADKEISVLNKEKSGKKLGNKEKSFKDQLKEALKESGVAGGGDSGGGKKEEKK